MLLVQEINFQLIQRSQNDNFNLLLLISFVIFLILLIIKHNHAKYFSTLFLYLFDYKLISQLLNDKTFARPSFFMDIASILILGSSLYVISTHNQIPIFALSNFASYNILFLNILLVAFYFILFRLINSFLGSLLKISQVANIYSNMSLNILKVASIIIYPVLVIFYLFSSEIRELFSIFILLIIILSIIVRFFVFFNISFKRKILNHYSILYLCVFEILPILYIVKFLVKV